MFLQVQPKLCPFQEIAKSKALWHDPGELAVLYNELNCKSIPYTLIDVFIVESMITRGNNFNLYYFVVLV